MDKVQKKFFLAVFSTFVLLLFSQFSYAVTIDKVVVFGDSLSDNGNVYSITSKVHKVLPFVPVIPKNNPYYNGRFSNGPVWIENLADSLKVKLSNYAYGGAWVEPVWDSRQLIPLDLGQQVNYYLVGNMLDFHKDKHLFVIWDGANDYIQGRKDVEYATTNAVKSIREQLESLIYHKAKQFLILTLPDLSGLPDVVKKGPEFVLNVKQLAEMHNKKLLAMLEEEKVKHPTVKFAVFDLSGYFGDVTDHPEKYNLKNVKEACYGGYYYLNNQLVRPEEIDAAKTAGIEILGNASLRAAYLSGRLAESGLGNEVCSNPDEYLFWDQVHPTRIAHVVISTYALTELYKNDIHGNEIG